MCLMTVGLSRRAPWVAVVPRVSRTGHHGFSGRAIVTPGEPTSHGHLKTATEQCERSERDVGGDLDNVALLTERHHRERQLAGDMPLSGLQSVLNGLVPPARSHA